MSSEDASELSSSGSMRIEGNANMLGSDGSTIPLPLQQQRYYHNAANYNANLTNSDPVSPLSVVADEDNSQNFSDQDVKKKKSKTILYIVLAVVAIVLLLILAGFAYKNRWFSSENKSVVKETVPARLSGTSAQTGRISNGSSSSALSLQTNINDARQVEYSVLEPQSDVEREKNFIEQDYDTPTYMPTPLETTPIETDDEESNQSIEKSIYMTPVAVPIHFEEISKVHKDDEDDLKKYQPPPSSFFGASIKTRGEAAQDVSDSVLQNAQSMANIYDKKANAVLAVNGLHVHDQVSRDMGWAAIGECGAPEIGESGKESNVQSFAAPASIYQAMKEQLPLHAVREGSSASTIVTPKMAADERADQFAAGRAKAQEITAQTQAAIGNIYTRKRHASAGLTVAAQAKSNNLNDPNFEYINSFTNTAM